MVAGAGTLALVGGIDDDGSDGGDDEQDDNEAFGRRALRGLQGRGANLMALNGVIGKSDEELVCFLGRHMQ